MLHLMVIGVFLGSFHCQAQTASGSSATTSWIRENVPHGWHVAVGQQMADGQPGFAIQQDAIPSLVMAWVPAGKLHTGIDTGYAQKLTAEFGLEAELEPLLTRHWVEMEGFWIGVLEITAIQWQQATGDTPSVGTHHLAADEPARNISWQETKTFCTKCSVRLPTQTEWEYAARGPHAMKYPWGDPWHVERCCNSQNQPKTHGPFPVGSFPGGRSWCWARDLAGNVAEWCADTHEDGRVAVRGGSYLDSAPYIGSFWAHYLPPHKDDKIGFRVALSP